MFYFDDFYGKKILKSSLLKDYDCFFTTRDFVLTASSRKDLEKEAENNRMFLKEKLNAEINTAIQVHGINSEFIKPGKYIYDNTDALISDIPGSLLLMNFADCVPIILYDKITNTGSIVHAGWRGTAGKILYHTIVKMRDEKNVDPKNITVLIGPAIGKCCFETDEDVFREIVHDKNDSRLYTKKGNKYYTDLKLANYNLAVKAGVSNIDICDYCTSCMSGIFFSYRKEKGVTARHSAVVKIKGDD